MLRRDDAVDRRFDADLAQVVAIGFERRLLLLDAQLLRQHLLLLRAQLRLAHLQFVLRAIEHLLRRQAALPELLLAREVVLAPA